jgi:hypothetical protein
LVQETQHFNKHFCCNCTKERERERDGFLALNLQSNFVELGFWIHQEFQGGFPPTFGSSLSRCYSESTIAHMFLSLSLSLSLSGWTVDLL